MCFNCNLGIAEDPKHVILQCPYNQTETDDMFWKSEKLKWQCCYLYVKAYPYSVFLLSTEGGGGGGGGVENT